MKKKVKVLFGIILCIVLCCTLFTACSKKNDDVTEVLPENEDTVTNAKDFYEKLKAAQGKEYAKYTLKLGGDIDLSTLGRDWVPIGQSLSKAFCGTLDGQGHSINGLKITGWDENGTPKMIAKEIIGWLENGDPVYKSTEIIDLKKGSDLGDGFYAVDGIVREGDDEDGNYVALENGKGVFEQRASYGSIGLFGYTNGATIKDVTINNADISFYASGNYSYSGIVSGYDVSSTFDNVKVNNGTIKVSTIFDREYTYNTTYGTPNGRYKDVNENKQFIGGIVGYTKGSTTLSDGKPQMIGTQFISVASNGFTFSNANYSAFYDAGIVIKGDKDSATLAMSGTEKQYSVSKILGSSRVSNSAFFPEQLMVGGIAGYVSGGTLNEVSVNGFNKATVGTERANEISGQKYLIAESLYFGGISAGLYDSAAQDVSVKNTFASGVYWVNWNAGRGYSLVEKKATVGGAFADLGNSVVTASEGKTNQTENFYAEIGESQDIQNICMGGFAGYADDQSSLSNITVKNVYFYSADIGDGQSENTESDLGSTVSGAVSVLRNSSLENASVDTLSVWISSGRGDAAYAFTKGIVSQTIGNSFFSGATATNVHKYKSQSELDTADYSDVTPVQFNNNYVNEDGFKSVRLYFQKDGKYDKVYVTAFAEIIPADAKGNSYYEEDIFVSVDLSGSFSEGDVITSEPNQYFRYDEQSNTYIDVVSEGMNQTVEKDSGKTEYSFKKYTSEGKYAVKKIVYRVELTVENKNMPLTGVTYYEYNEREAKFAPTTDSNAAEGKTYYVRQEDAVFANYYLLVTVYSESGKVIVVDQKNVDNEDDDVLAKGKYVLSKDTVETTTIEYSVAETYLNVFFAEGTGFKKDVDGNTITYYDSTVFNRQFDQYVKKTGRPTVDMSSVLYN